jgi:glycosyltransferase involved in cell wall biosynthesis
VTAPFTVGYHAPPPGSHSGVADYAETLRGALARLTRVERGAAAADIHLYHLGNNRLHQADYARALATPGIVVLHDAVLHHFLLGTCSREQYLAEWIHNYGVWKRDLGEELWRDRARAHADPRYFRFPMLRRIVERSRGVIVHNPGAAAIVGSVNSLTPVAVIPHFCEIADPPDHAVTARFRQQLGIGQDVTLFNIFGYLREPKRVVQCIETFKKLHLASPKTALLLAGEIVSNDLARLLRSEPAQPAIFRTGHLSDEDFRIACAAADGCLNLRYPGVGETSGITVRLMGLAKPVIVTDSAENADFPPQAVLRVAPGVAEAAELFDHMILVAEFPALAREIGREARLHIQQHHSLDTVARRFWEVLCAACSSASAMRF